MMFFNLLRAKLRSLPILLIISTRQCFAYQPIGRWGQGFAVTTAGVFVYGGKTDQYNSYSYTSAPNSNDLLFLPLNSTFDSTSPPWKLLNASSNVSGRSGPAIAWHTVSAINDSSLMVFGGEPGPDSPTESFSLADSANFLNIADLSAPHWTFEPQSWGSEPARRMRHSSTLAGSSSLLIIGGEKADGSNDAFSDNYAFDMNAASFLTLSNTTGPANIFDHRSVMLSDGRLLVLGGYDQSQGALVPFSDIWSFDSRNATSTWSLLTPSVTNLPTPRRAFVATLLYNNKVLIHGGTDAVLQQNYDDGWILDTSSDPLTWTEVNTLTQLGSRRDHFAFSSGTQVLFGFGYSSSGPSSPTLYIYDAAKDAFVTTFTPSPSLSTSSLTSSAPTSTQHGHTSVGASLTGSAGSASTDNPNSQNADVGSKSTRTIALAIVFSVLGAVIVIVVLYYIRRRHLRHGQFVSLADDDGDSARSHSIPAVVMIDDNLHSERRSKFRIFSSFHLPNILTNTHGNKPELPPRRDMLADEDAYDSEWYHLKRVRDSERTSWSFRSFMSTRLRGQERSSTTNGSIRSHKRETSGQFLDDYFAYEEAGLLERKERYPDHVVKSLPPCPDPFVDPAEHEAEDTTSLDMNSAPVHVPSFQADSFSLNLTEGPSSGFAPKPADPFIERLDSNSQNTFPHSTEITSPTAYATSLINANRGPLQPISPTDPWWRRFTRQSFLDRKLSSTSKKSPSIDYKEYNATLMSIEEQTDTLALKAVASRSVEIVDNHVRTKSMSNVYDKTHGKSFSSFQTADTEAIEKIGCMVDVVQRNRTSSRRSSYSSVGVISFDGQQSLFKSDDPSAENLTASTTQATSSQAHHSDTAETPKDVETDLATSPLVAEDSSGGLVAARIRAYERKLSQDNESPGKTRKDSDDNKVKYGLAPRQSLFVANPDR